MNNDQIHLVGLCGSLRKGSYNRLLLNAAMEMMPEGMSMEIAQFADLPLYDADLDLPAATERPRAVTEFRNKLARADGVFIVSPEYNYSIPGGLKNAIDWASRGEDSPLLKKPVAVAGATIGLWGTVRMQMAFQGVFLFLDMKPVYKPEVLVAQADKKFDIKGKLTDETTKKLLRQKLAALKEVILKEQPVN